jgi:hypothetical protein
MSNIQNSGYAADLRDGIHIVVELPADYLSNSENATTEGYSVVRTEGHRRVNRLIKDYNLDAIISVGYRVNSRKGTQFRIWANQVLKDYLLQGYVLNANRLKQQLESIDKLKRGLALIQKAQLESLDQTEAKGIKLLRK